MNDPRRLRDGALGDDMRLLVRAAEDDVLDDEAVARLRGRLVAAGVASSVAPVAKATMARARGLLAKLVLVVGGGALAVAAMVHFGAREVSAPSPAVAAQTPIAVAPTVAESSAPIAPVVETVSVTDLPRPAAPPARSTRAVAELRPAAPAATTSPREGLLLLRARHALPGDPTLALSLVEQHEAEFPQSQLAPERDKIRREAEAKGAR
jgi:hypothetical protein